MLLPDEQEHGGSAPYDDPTAGYFDDYEPAGPADLGPLIIIDDSVASDVAGEGDGIPDPDKGVGLVFVTVDDPRVYGYERPKPPLGLRRQARARRKMAQMLADDLADPPYRQEGGGHDWAHAAMEVPVGYAPVQRMLSDAEQVAESAILVPGETWVATGYEEGNGLVFRVHGPAWSLVFTMKGPVGSVYVCSDDVPEVPLKVKVDDARAVTELSVMVFKVVNQLQRISMGGDKASYNPNLARQG